MLIKTLKIALPATVLMTGLLTTSIQSYAKPEYAKKEKKGCTTCHVTMGKKDLNDTGKCYKEHEHSLEACKTK